MKLEISYKKKTGKFTSIWRLKNMLLNNQGVRRNKKCSEACENRKTTYQNLWDAAKSSSKREIHSDKCLY